MKEILAKVHTVKSSSNKYPHLSQTFFCWIGYKPELTDLEMNQSFDTKSLFPCFHWQAENLPKTNGLFCCQTKTLKKNTKLYGIF